MSKIATPSFRFSRARGKRKARRRRAHGRASPHRPTRAGRVYNRPVLTLSRTVRLCLNDDDRGPADPPRDNTFSAWPPPRGLARYYEIDVDCAGEADPQTGYFINIKHIDTAVRDHGLPVLRAALDAGRGADVPMGRLLADLLRAVDPALGGSVRRLSLALTPRVRYAIESTDMQHTVIRQQYEFSAAHRLHVPALSDEENRAVFGKCNNPAGHGHNYAVEVAVRSPIDPDGRTLDVAALDAAVDAHAIEHLDHKHLNTDVPQFAELNPSVENIVKVVWGMLAEPIAALGPGTALDEVRVWETGKTVCAYRGD